MTKDLKASLARWPELSQSVFRPAFPFPTFAVAQNNARQGRMALDLGRISR